jgi:DNA-binding XRE family transcriptional regulator
MVATTRRVVVSVDPMQLRCDLGLTSGQFARLIGASYSTVSRWEHGHAEPDGALASICASIRASVDGPHGEVVRRLVREHSTLTLLLDALFNAYRPPP